MTTEVIEHDVDSLADERDVARVLEIRDRAGWLLDFAKGIKARADAALLRHLIANGPVIAGENLYVAADHRKEKKCRDNGRTLDALFTATGGDFDEVAQCLSANAWKAGACRVPLKDDWGNYFDVVEVPFIKDGVTAKQLVTINKTFLK